LAGQAWQVDAYGLKGDWNRHLQQLTSISDLRPFGFGKTCSLADCLFASTGKSVLDMFNEDID
jgi:hypothetical protein